VIFIPNYKTAEVLQPCKQPLDLPATFVSTKRTTILRWRATTIRSMRGDHVDVATREAPVKGVAIISHIADEALRKFPQEPRLQQRVNERHFMRRSTLDA